MIPSDKTEIQRTGNMVAEQSIAMKFDENSIAHIMSVLTDLYSDPEMAVLREYATNARDSHIEAGQTRPIEVTTPSPLSPVLRIKDYGTGLSVNDVEQIYSRYGASTKRGTNEQTGMLGLGCKSGLTYTSQFNVIAIQAGVKITVSVGRKDDGSGVMEVIDTCATDEPNGVEIIVPAKQDNQFFFKAENFFRFWPSGSVLINGVPNVSVLDSASKISDNLYMVKNNGYSYNVEDYLVMGNVAYPTTLYDAMYGRSFRVVAFVDIGEVDFTPSREQLHMTPKTKAVIDRIKQEFVANSRAAVQKDIDLAKTGPEAVDKFLMWSSALSGLSAGNYKWNGKPLETDWRVDTIKFHLWYKRNASRMESRIGVDLIPKSLVVMVDDIHDFSLTATLKRKVRQYLENNDLNVNTIVFADKAPWQQWVLAAAVADLEDIKAIRFSSTPRNGKIAGTYEIWDGYRKTVSSLPTNKPIVFVGPREDIMNHAAYFDNLDCTVVILGENRWEKFKRDIPSAMHITDYAKSELDKAIADASDDEKAAYALKRTYRSEWMSLNANKIDDPEVVSFINNEKHLRNLNTSKFEQALAKWMRMGATFNSSGWEKPGMSEDEFVKRYPLTAAYLRGYNKTTAATNDLYLYMNTKYQETINE